MTINDLATERWAKDEPNPKIGFWCVLFIFESNSANIFANGCKKLFYIIINSMPTFQNIVATVNLDCRLDLKTTALHARKVVSFLILLFFCFHSITLLTISRYKHNCKSTVSHNHHGSCPLHQQWRMNSKATKWRQGRQVCFLFFILSSIYLDCYFVLLSLYPWNQERR